MTKPYLIPIEPSYGAPETLIFIGSSLTDNSFLDVHRWWWLIRSLGWPGAIAQLCWETDTHLSIESLAQQGAAAPAIWNHARKQFKRIGKSYFPKLLWSAGIGQVSIFALTLGTPIAYYAMREWLERDIKIQDAIFLAGLVKRDRAQNWARVVQHIEGQLFNHYNNEDLMLNRFCQLLDWRRSPCGIKPIRETHERIRNIDAAPWMQTACHTADNYRLVLEQQVSPHWSQRL